MFEIQVIEWERFNPRKDYKTMPWIRLDTNLITNPKFFSFNGEQKWCYVALLLLCGQSNTGKIEGSLEYFAKIADVKNEVMRDAINIMEKYSFITTSRTAHERQGQDVTFDTYDTYDTYDTKYIAQDDSLNSSPEHCSTKTSVTEKTKPDNSKHSELRHKVIEYLNRKTNKSYSPKSKHAKLIDTRAKEGNYSFEDFKTAIDSKYNSWHGTEFEKYLRPETLFGNKFDGYLNEGKGTVTMEDIFCATPSTVEECEWMRN